MFKNKIEYLVEKVKDGKIKVRSLNISIEGQLRIFYNLIDVISEYRKSEVSRTTLNPNNCFILQDKDYTYYIVSNYNNEESNDEINILYHEGKEYNPIIIKYSGHDLYNEYINKFISILLIR